MHLKIEKKALKDLEYWKKYNKKKYQKIINILKNIQNTPFKGIGKPKALKHKYSGYWSRRIDEKHRLIYTIKNNIIMVISCRYHYE